MDYRNSSFCEEITNLEKKKEDLVVFFKNQRRTTDNHYNIVRDQEKIFHKKFAEIFNNKCFYCGVPVKFFGYAYFQIDHYIPNKNNNINNLVYSCIKCNGWKNTICLEHISTLKIPNENGIRYAYNRNDDYSISIQDDYLEYEEICTLYEKLRFSRVSKRLDYLLLELDGLKNKCKQNNWIDVSDKLASKLQELKEKRNKMQN